jgi:hypothetical protein
MMGLIIENGWQVVAKKRHGIEFLVERSHQLKLVAIGQKYVETTLKDCG